MSAHSRYRLLKSIDTSGALAYVSLNAPAESCLVTVIAPHARSNPDGLAAFAVLSINMLRGGASTETGMQGYDSNDFCGKIAVLNMVME